MDADALQTAHQMPVEDAIWTINVQDNFLSKYFPDYMAKIMRSNTETKSVFSSI